MNKILTQYIKRYYSHFIKPEEHSFYNRWRKEVKYYYAIEQSPHLVEYYKKKYSIEDDHIFITDEEYDEYDISVTNRIITEHRDKIFFNYCPVCGTLARTPYAKQCPKGHRWG
jgi:hypothetical protein